MGRGANGDIQGGATVLSRGVAQKDLVTSGVKPHENKRLGNKGTTHSDGTVELYNRRGELYRIIRPDGTKEWIDQNKDLHRADGPAIIRPDGTKEWYWHGQLRLEDDSEIEHAAAA